MILNIYDSISLSTIFDQIRYKFNNLVQQLQQLMSKFGEDDARSYNSSNEVHIATLVDVHYYETCMIEYEIKSMDESIQSAFLEEQNVSNYAGTNESIDDEEWVRVG